MQAYSLKSSNEDIKKAARVVKENIPGKRKGMDKPAYEHSFDVKRGLLLSISEPEVGDHPIWKELQDFRFEE